MNPLPLLGVMLPIVQAPIAGVSTPEMAAVSNAGGLGSIGVGATDAAGARAMIEATRLLTDRPFNANLFVHTTPNADPAGEKDWLGALRPLFQRFRNEPPAALRTIYTSFAVETKCSRCSSTPLRQSSASTLGYPLPTD